MATPEGEFATLIPRYLRQAILNLPGRRGSIGANVNSKKSKGYVDADFTLQEAYNTSLFSSEGSENNSWEVLCKFQRFVFVLDNDRLYVR